MSLLELLGIAVMLTGMISFARSATRLALTDGGAWGGAETVLVAGSITLMLAGAVCMAQS
ncbi:MAG: hypothetical protein NTV28_12760 [Propionibacteriales bacterium]|nr:hypothetical protein [Propionibacteriales bacterium]